MPANEFEKKVQQTLDELRLKPSEEIWPMVAMRIRKDKRRRRGLIWSGLLVLLLGGAGYWWAESHSRHQESPIAAGHSNQKEIENPAASPKSPANLKIAPKAVDENKSSPGLNSPALNSEDEPKDKIAPAEKKPGKFSHVVKKENNPDNKKANNPDNPQNYQSSPGAGKHVPFVKKVRSSDKPSNDKTLDLVAKRRPNENESMERNIEDQERNKNPFENNLVFNPQLLAYNVKVYSQPMPSNPAAIPPANHGMPQSLVAKEGPAKKDKIKDHKKWSLGISGRMGSSDVMIRSNSSRMNAASPNYLTTLAPSGGRFLGDSVYRGASFSWGVGVYVKLNLNKGFALKSGLDYKQYDFRTLVGNYVNSQVQISNGYTYLTLNSFYAAGYTREYLNHFQYLELPVSVELQMNKSQKMPLNLDAGLALGWLLNSNYLHRDYTSNVLFKDNALLMKIPLSLHAGVTVGLFNQSKYPLSVGPQFQYMVGDLKKNSGGLKQHLWFLGLKANLALWEFGPAQRSHNK